jgi:hypothetical protein
MRTLKGAVFRRFAIMAAAFSAAMITGTLSPARISVGKIDASTTRKGPRPQRRGNVCRPLCPGEQFMIGQQFRPNGWFRDFGLWRNWRRTPSCGVPASS